MTAMERMESEAHRMMRALDAMETLVAVAEIEAQRVCEGYRAVDDSGAPAEDRRDAMEPAEQRLPDLCDRLEAVIRALRHLDEHTLQHTGAWGRPSR